MNPAVGKSGPGTCARCCGRGTLQDAKCERSLGDRDCRCGRIARAANGATWGGVGGEGDLIDADRGYSDGGRRGGCTEIPVGDRDGWEARVSGARVSHGDAGDHERRSGGGVKVRYSHCLGPANAGRGAEYDNRLDGVASAGVRVVRVRGPVGNDGDAVDTATRRCRRRRCGAVRGGCDRDYGGGEPGASVRHRDVGDGTGRENCVSVGPDRGRRTRCSIDDDSRGYDPVTAAAVCHGDRADAAGDGVVRENARRRFRARPGPQAGETNGHVGECLLAVSPVRVRPEVVRIGGGIERRVGRVECIGRQWGGRDL